MRQAAAGLAPQLRPRRLVVRLRVGRVAVLVGLERARDLLGQAVGDAVVGLRRLRRDVGRRDHDLGAVGAQQVDLLARHLVGHHRDDAVALQPCGDREPGAGVARRRLDDRAAGTQAAVALGRLDQAQRHAILDRAARVEQLHLRDELRLDGRVDATQPHERRVADRVEDRISDVGLQRGVRTHGVESKARPGGENCERPAYGRHALADPPPPSRPRAPARRRRLPAPAAAVVRRGLRGQRLLRQRERRLGGVGAVAVRDGLHVVPGGCARRAPPAVGRGPDGAQRRRPGPRAAGRGGGAAVRRPARHVDHRRRLRRPHDEQPGLGRGHPRRDERALAVVRAELPELVRALDARGAARPRHAAAPGARALQRDALQAGRAPWIRRAAQRAGVPGRPVRAAARRRARRARDGRRRVAARPRRRGVRRSRQQRHPARADRARRAHRARRRAQMRLRPRRALLRRSGRRRLRHAHVVRRRARAAALRPGRGRQLDLRRPRRSDRQHRAGRAGAAAGGRRRLEPEPRADAGAAAAGRAVGAADACTPEGMSRRRPVRGVGARAGHAVASRSPRSTGRASTRSASRSRTPRATSARSPHP